MEKDNTKKDIRIVTMPSFAVYVDGEIAKFKNEKTQEMLALLVNNGRMPMTHKELISKLWPDEDISKRTLGRCLVTWSNLKKSLDACGAQHIIGTNGKERFVNRDTFKCDLYEMLEGSETYIGAYDNKYLEGYPWAETEKKKLAAYLMQSVMHSPAEAGNADAATALIDTMPCFSITIQGKALKFKNAKAKELLAAITDQAGKGLSAEEAAWRLCPGKPISEKTLARIRLTQKKLDNELKRYGVAHIIKEKDGRKYVDEEAVACPYFDILKGDEEAMKAYDGKHLEEYKWAGKTNEKLEKLIAEEGQGEA